MAVIEEGTQHSVLHAAISSGSVGAFEGVLDAARKYLARHQVGCMLVHARWSRFLPLPSLIVIARHSLQYRLRALIS